MSNEPAERSAISDILKKTGIVVGSAAVGFGTIGCDCGKVVDPPPPPSDSTVVDPPPPPSDSAVDAGTDAATGTDSTIVDPPPPPMDSGTDAGATLINPDATRALPLDPSFRLELRVAGVHEDRAVILHAHARHADADTRYEWSVAGGTIVPIDGRTAHWTPPDEPRRCMVQVAAVRVDDAAAVAAIELEV